MGRDEQAYLLNVHMWPAMARRTLAHQMDSHRRLLLPGFETVDRYLSHRATYQHLGIWSSRSGVAPEVRYGLWANQLPNASEQEDSEPIATQIEEDVVPETGSPGARARRAETGSRGAPRHSSAAGSSSSGRR